MATKAKTRDGRVSLSCAETPEGTVGTNPMAKRPNTDNRRISRHLALLKNEDVDRWHRNMRSGSEKTAKVWLAAVGRFLEWAGKAPEDLFTLTGDAATRLLEDYRDEFQSKASSTLVVIKAVRSLLQRKGIAITQRIKVRRKDSAHEQHIPTQAELRKVLGVANLRARAAISLLAFSGCRIEVMGDGTDGLRIGDIPDLKVDGGEIAWRQVPARIVVRGALSKTSKAFFTFLGGEGVQVIEAYLRARSLRGENLTPQSVVIGAVKVRYKGRKKDEDIRAGATPITSTNISDAIRAPMRQAGVNERPYIWRSYFAATADRCRDLPTEWREFFMGHNSGVAKTYAVNKGLPPEKIEEMRAAYAKTLPLLETNEPEALSKVRELERRLEALRKAQADPDQMSMKDLREQTPVLSELAKARTNAMSEGELAARAKADDLSEKLEQAADEIAGLEAQLATAIEMINNPPKNGNGNAPKIVNEAELEALLADGWTFVSVLPSGKLLVKREAA